MKIKQTPAFKRDFKRFKKKNFKMEKVKEVVALLVAGQTDILTTSYQDHALKGNWQGYRELHIAGDWLLIYKIEKDEIVLVLTRMGTHDELF